MNKTVKLIFTFIVLVVFGFSIGTGSVLTAGTISESGGKNMDYEKLKIKSYKYWDLYLHENQCYLGRVFVQLKDEICESLFRTCDFPPLIESVAKTYSSIIKPEWKFKISEVILTKSGTGSSFIIAKLLFNGHENIYKDNKPISAGLHMTRVNSDDSILEADEIGNLLIADINKCLKGKFMKIATRNGVADLEFGMSGSSWRIRAEERIK